MLNAAQDLKAPQGLTDKQTYEATVVDNNDPKKIGRIRCRVPTVFDGIEDEDLPWAIPDCNHFDGATAVSGCMSIPKISSKVQVRFQDGSPSHPIYKGYSMDDKTQMEELNENYPNRAVCRFRNHAIIVVDTETNEVFIRNPGDLNIYIRGSVNLMVDGDVNETIIGNRNTYVKGNVEEIVEGDFRRQVKGDSVEFSDGKTVIYSSDSAYITSQSSLNLFGAPINENTGSAPSKPDDVEKPQFEEWPGIWGYQPVGHIEREKELDDEEIMNKTE